MAYGVSAPSPSKMAFLDTNALINLFWFWDACTALQIRLDRVKDWRVLETKLSARSRFAGQFSTEGADGIVAGLKCFWNMKQRNNDYQYCSSVVCGSEMHHVMLESMSMVRLVRRKIPRAVRVKRPLVLYRKALDARDYSAIRRNVENFRESLRQDYGIDIIDAEQASAGTAVNSEDVWNTARQIWSRVLIDVMDSYIYAAAVEIEADLFLTSDGALFQALYNLWRPTGEWVALTRSLKLALGKKQAEMLPQPLKPGKNWPR